MKIKYVINSNEKTTHVILTTKGYNELMEDISDLAIVAERGNEETISHEDLIKKLKKDETL